MSQNEIIDTWFRLHDAMFRDGYPNVTALRPPSLRDACYARVLAARTKDTEATPETIEAFVNGLELGALSALRAAWEKRAGKLAERPRKSSGRH
jgi:ABC-type nitrate/sulfonate/bicarbonate transport system substrate-binding protein